MMTADCLEKLQELCQNKTYEIDGRTYSVNTLRPVLPPPADSVQVTTLGAFCEEAMRLKEFASGVISVVSPTQVDYITDHDHNNRRQSLLSAKIDFHRFQFDRYMDTETFVISLISLFEANEDQRNLVALLSHLVAEESIQLQDDGVSTSVTKKSGIAKLENATLTPFHKLRPFRTFSEMEEQPESMFLLRLKQGNGSINASLIETDGGRWKLPAVKKIHEFIKDKVEGIPIIY